MSPAAADTTGIGRWQTPALAVGIVGVVLSAIGWYVAPIDFFRAYLTSWLFWFSIAGGSVGVLCLQYITGGEWGLMIRRPLGAASRSVWMLAVLVIPLVFGMAKVFPWADPSWPKFHEIQQQKGFYLNPTAFWVRNAIYFAFFLIWAWRIRVLSLEDVFATKLLAITEQEPQFDAVLELARALREQVDWDAVRERTEESPFAKAFFTLVEELGIIAPSNSPTARADR